MTRVEKKVDEVWWDEVDKTYLLDLEKARKEFFDWLNQEPNEKLKKAYRRYKDSFLNAELVKE
jgi:hypothetical protein